MSSTATTAHRATEPSAKGPHVAAMPPPKLRRRPAVVAGGVLAICLGALVAGWAWTTTTNTREVLAARHTIMRGELIEDDDLVRVRIGSDPALTPVPASGADGLVGARAALDIAEGSLMTAASTTTAIMPSDGRSIVGASLTSAQLPGVELHNGDQVRIVVTPPQGAEAASGPPVSSDAEVVDSRVNDQTGNVVVDLLVRREDATVLAARIATGNIALVLDSRER